jgi:hypothetical protein
VVFAWCASTTFCSCSSVVFEQRVAGTMDKTRWTNSTACSFPWTNFLIQGFKYDQDKLWLVYTQIVPVIFEPPCIFLYLGTSKFYFLCHTSHRLPGLATTATEWISDDS